MDDAAIIRAVQGGDREAFGPLVERYHGMVYGLCRRLTGDPRAADELAHDAFVEAWLKLGQLRDPDRFGGWLKTLTLNLCRMRGRQSRGERFRASQLAFADGVPDPAAPPGCGADEENDALRTRVSAGLAHLAAPQRLALALHYGEGLSCEEMGRFLGVPPGTVMSRLQRARQALKELVTQNPMNEEPAPMTDEQFKQEVQAELILLLRLFPEEKSTRERLDVVLKRSPERLARLVGETTEPQILDSLILLLPRLGPAALGVVLEVALTGEQPAADRARAVLRGLLGRAQPIHKQDWTPGTPPREAYWLVELLIDSAIAPEAKVALLIELATASTEESMTGLLLSTLTGWPEAAWGVLRERLIQTVKPDSPAPTVIWGLCRYGNQFLGEINDLIDSLNPARQELGLAAAETFSYTFSRTLELTPVLGVPPGSRFRELRGRGHFAAIITCDLDPDLLTRLRCRVAGLYAGDGAGHRERMLTILGQLRGSDTLETIERGLEDGEPAVRLAAIRALAAVAEADPAHAEMIGLRMMTLAREGTAPERRAAVETLARLKRPEARPLLSELTADPDEAVQEAAVTALGELNEPEDRAALQALMTSSDERLRKAAVKALYRDSRTPRAPSPIEVAREQRLREGHTPFTFISLDAALRALPEPGPYVERELTRQIAFVCIDFAATRRYLIEKGLMTRAGGVYELTGLGRTIWRVERFISAHAMC